MSRPASRHTVRTTRARHQGFTLLEVLVALVVMAVGLGAGVRALGQAADVAGALAERTLARWVAEDHFALLRARAELPPPGLREGRTSQGGRLFVWAETAVDPPESPFRRVEVRVRADQPAAPDLARLTIYLLRPPQ